MGWRRLWVEGSGEEGTLSLRLWLASSKIERMKNRGVQTGLAESCSRDGRLVDLEKHLVGAVETEGQVVLGMM